MCKYIHYDVTGPYSKLMIILLLFSWIVFVWICFHDYVQIYNKQ